MNSEWGICKRVLMVIALLGIAACKHSGRGVDSDVFKAPAAPTYGRALIIGTDAHIARFQTELAALLPDISTAPGWNYFACLKGGAPFTVCENPAEAISVGKKRVVFSFMREHPKAFSSFTTAWHKTQAALGGSETEFLLTFTNHLPSPACINTGPGCITNHLCGDGCGRPLCSACS